MGGAHDCGGLLLSLLLLCATRRVIGLMLQDGRTTCQTPMEGRCDFRCDSADCCDELDCGYGKEFECDFEVSSCGWKDKSNPGNIWQRRKRGETLQDSGPSSDYTLGTDAGWFMAVAGLSGVSDVALLVSPNMQQAAATCEVRLRYFVWDSGHTGLGSASLWGEVSLPGGHAVLWRPGGSSVRGWRRASFFLGRVAGPFALSLHSERARIRPGDVAIDHLEFRNCALPEPKPDSCPGGSTACQRGGCVRAEQVCDGTDDCGDGSDESEGLCGHYRKCDFESGTCEWSQGEESNLSWSRINQTQTYVTFDPQAGPGRDHTLNMAAGHFLYISSPMSDGAHWTHLHSPVLEPTNSMHPCTLVLYAHLFGPRVGVLSVLILTPKSLKPVWHKDGDHGDLWFKGQVDIVVNSTFQILIVGSVRDSGYGGVALDDLILSPNCRNSSEPPPLLPKIPPHHASCEVGQFECAKGGCVQQDRVCDFALDCPDGSDEAECGNTSFETSSRGWTDLSVGTLEWTVTTLDTDSSQGRYMFVGPALGQGFGDARALSPILGPSGPSCSLHFSYQLSGNFSQPAVLSVSVVDQALGTRSEGWHQRRAAQEWHEAVLYIGARPRGFQIEVRGHVHAFLPETQKVAVDDFQFVNCDTRYLPVNSKEVSCNFETGLCGWYQDQADSFDWDLQSGSDHTIGSGVSVSVPMWSPSLRGLTGRLLTFPQSHSSSSICLSFWYLLYGPQTGSLSVKLRWHSDGAETVLWTRRGAHGNTWHLGNCPIAPSSGNFQLVLEALRDGYDGRVAVDDVMVLSQPCPAHTSCSFDASACEFSSTGAERWVRQNRVSGSISHGPETDHSLGTETGFYMIADTSREVLPSGRTTTLSSAVRSAPLRPECVQFWYHVGREKPGSLRVFVQEVDGDRVEIFSDSISQGEDWRHGNGNIVTSRDWQLVFEAEGAGGVGTHIAIDDITFSPHSCPEPASVCDFERGMCSWTNTQNPKLDQLDWDWTSTEVERQYPTPPHDHSLGTVHGHFLFLPSSPRETAGQKAWLLSPHLPPTRGTCLRFWAYRNPLSEGRLRVVLLSAGEAVELFRVEGAEQWTRYDVLIRSEREYQIVFEGVKGHSGVQALDDIIYTPGVNCAGEQPDPPSSAEPPDSTAGVVASIIILLLLLATLAVLLVFYLRHRQGAAPSHTPEMSFNNITYSSSDQVQGTGPQH
ncbi:apical endosomal glycoprotein isoform X2 [Lepisosteus oculatus]|uniref:apical endosomal glycoprotein isoform X2 n=1 Tax=Lepisosteus oculatus TaxID=7918 RepID=UPI003714559F